MQIKDYKQKIVKLGVDPNNPELVKNLLKEKDIEIKILNKNLKIIEGHHIQTLKLVCMQTKRDEFYKDVLNYKEKGTQYQNQIKKQEERMNLMEKKKIELESFKKFFTTMPTQSVQSGKYS